MPLAVIFFLLAIAFSAFWVAQKVNRALKPKSTGLALSVSVLVFFLTALFIMAGVATGMGAMGTFSR